MIKIENYGFASRLYILLLALLAFSIPIHFRFTLYVFGLTLILSLYLLVKTGSYNYFYKNRPALGFISFWCIYALSLLYSANIQYGLNDVFQKVSIILLPVIFAPFISNETNNNRIKNAFLLGLLVSSLFFIFRAFENSIYFTPEGISFRSNPVEIPWENYFFYVRFVSPHHPTYYSMYLALGIIFIAERIRHSNVLRQKAYYFLFASYLLFVTYFTSSKAGLVVSIIISLLSLVWVLKRRGKIILLIALGAFFSIAATLLLNNERLAISAYNIKKFMNEEKLDVGAKNNLVRFEIWRAIPVVFEENSVVFGTGAGDVNEVLEAIYTKKSIEYAQKSKLNAHNQYLQTLVGVGLLGLSILIAILGHVFWLSIKNRDMVLFMFLISISFHLLFESVFERVFGVIFFVFFTLFITSKYEVKRTNAI